MWAVAISTHTPHAGRDQVGLYVGQQAIISTHTPHAGRDCCPQAAVGTSRHFNSHAPCGARRALRRTDVTGAYFNSHAPCGARLHNGRENGYVPLFQLTRPMRGATASTSSALMVVSISTHTPHAGRDKRICQSVRVFTISTHTPHAGRDVYGDFTIEKPFNFNSHAPCGARPEGLSFFPIIFISTHTPHAGRDIDNINTWAAWSNFNSHAPCGARLEDCFGPKTQYNFNSHAPCGARRRTVQQQSCLLSISTHTPHAGRDSLL